MLAKTINKLPFILLMLMAVSAVLAMEFRPTHRIADDREKVDLETMIPTRFGEWHVVDYASGQIVNPEVKQRLDSLYSQTLNRTYVNDNGAFVMLAIAYGADQSDSNQMHYPEVCYPSQGFQIESTQLGSVSTEYGDIRVKHLNTVMGTRKEPVTYWTTVGNRVVLAGRETKLEKLKYAIDGQIPDGLLFRVSTISSHTEQAYQQQAAFINQFVQGITPNQRLRLTGLGSQD